MSYLTDEIASQPFTSAIVLLCAHLGADLRALPDAAARELARPLPPGLADRADRRPAARCCAGRAQGLDPDRPRALSRSVILA